MTKFHTRYITSELEVPPGYVSLASLCNGDIDLKKVVSKAHCRGLIPAVKLCRHRGEERTGPVWVSKQHADEYLKDYFAPPSHAHGDADDEDRPVRTQSVTEAKLAARLDAATYATAIGLLARIADALEAIATQPKACDPVESGSWRDMNGECN